MKYRKTAVAGSFYPDSAEQINEELSVFLNVATEPQIQPRALIVPHAGYCYSGAIAGSAYAYLKNFSSKIKRVILLGPSHRVPLQGCAISSCDFFSSPLGDIPVDRKSYALLLQNKLVATCDDAHLLEHSLEVQLPFLQTCLHDFSLVPIVVGQCFSKSISEILNVLEVNEPSTLVVVSSDLSHFHSYKKAQLLDQITIAQILNYEYGLAGEDACGCYAVNGLLRYAKSQNWHVTLVEKANSGDICDRKSEVVGYASFVFY